MRSILKVFAKLFSKKLAAGGTHLPDKSKFTPRCLTVHFLPMSLFLVFVTRVRHGVFSKIHKNHYDKSRKFFHTILFTKNYDKKSYKLDIYKSPGWVYNDSPE